MKQNTQNSWKSYSQPTAMNQVSLCLYKNNFVGITEELKNIC